MEWSREKTLKLIGLLQENISLWNSTYIEKRLSRREKQFRKQKIRNIANVFKIPIAEVTKKIQHLRTQYNRELARETLTVNAQDPECRYESNWYAYDYLHFLKDSNKAFRVINQEILADTIGDCQTHNETTENEIDPSSPPSKKLKKDTNPEYVYCLSNQKRDELSLFGEYIANELRSIKCEKSLLLTKKRIQDIIFDVKMNVINESNKASFCATISQGEVVTSEKIWYTTPLNNTDTMVAQVTPAASLNEIIINNTCQYTTMKDDEH